MAIANTNLNMVELLKAELEREVKRAVTEELVKKEIAEFEARLREQIKPLVNEISFKGIKSIKDWMRLREELHVYLHWDGANPVTKEI
jgi:phage host-nuclease inhibitor protein Gam